MRGPRKWSVLLRKKQARSTQGTRIASEKSLMKQEIVPQGACLLLFCVVRFSSPLKSYRHLIMYALVNAAGFRFVQMLERLSHPGKKYLVGVQFCRLSFRRLIALLISDTLNHSCRCMMASRPDIPDPQWFHASVAPSRGNVPLWFRQDADLRFYDIDDSLFLHSCLRHVRISASSFRMR